MMYVMSEQLGVELDAQGPNAPPALSGAFTRHA